MNYNYNLYLQRMNYNKELKLFEMYSNIFINILFLKCRYSSNTEKIIKKFLKNNKNKIYEYISEETLCF